MNKFSEVKQILMTAFQVAHAKAHAAVLVDYPNRQIVDIDNQEDPFVKLFVFSPNTELASLTGDDIEVAIEGTLYVEYYFPTGSGTKSSEIYTDMLNEEFAGQTFSGVSVDPVKATVINNGNLVDWEGVMNSLHFRTSANKVC